MILWVGVALLIAYLLGSVSSSLVIAKILQLPDPRTQGSGNAGATNMLRVGGKYLALITLVGDAAKGFFAIMIARLLGVHGLMLGFVALAVVAGHIYPLYFQFRGGKGVATAWGALLGLSFLSAILAIGLWLVVLALTRLVSVASIAAVAASPILLLIFGNYPYLLGAVLTVLLVIWKHKENIERIHQGVEEKVDLKAF